MGETLGPEHLSRQQMFNQLCQGFSAVQKAAYPAATAGSGNRGLFCITLNLFALASVDTLQGVYTRRLDGIHAKERQAANDQVSQQ